MNRNLIFKYMDDLEKIKEELDDKLCEFCPWNNGDMPHTCFSLCEGEYCDRALENYLEKKSNEDE